MTQWILVLQNNDFFGVKQLIKGGADINERLIETEESVLVDGHERLSETDESVLACALRYRCDDDIIELLVENGADLFAVDSEGVSIFDNAIAYNYYALFKTFLDKGIDVNLTHRKSGFTPLMAAACYGRKEMVRLLLENGADPAALDERNLSASDYARKMQLNSILKLLENES